MFPKLDIFFIIMFVIVISAIIGLNIVAIIDKKISDVSINIPSIQIPDNKIIINVCEDKKGKINITVDKNNNINVDSLPESIKLPSPPLSEMKDDESIKLPSPPQLIKMKDNKNIEHFIVADANDLNLYEENKKKMIEQTKNTLSDEKINNPNKENIVNYNDDKANSGFYIGMQYEFEPLKGKKGEKMKKIYVTDNDFGWDAPSKGVGCANSSISQQYKTGNKSLLPNQIDCRRPNKLTAENYYKTHYKKQVIPIEDYRVRGYNYQDFTDKVQPGKLDIRILSQSTKGLPREETKFRNIPVAMNYGFHNTPALPMP